jgi:hypothetical protein
MKTSLSKRHTTLGRCDRVDFGLNSRFVPEQRTSQTDDLVGVVSASNKIVSHDTAPAQASVTDEVKTICFDHQFDVIIVFHFYVRMSDKR